jgi:hypothetical protein
MVSKGVELIDIHYFLHRILDSPPYQYLSSTSQISIQKYIFHVWLVSAF